MGYEVTATRRRPQQFKDLAGQEFTAATLENTIKSRSIANAYLFSGPRGCGKTSSARIFAKALNCMATDAPNPTPCGKCESCLAIAASSSLDVIEIDGASNTSVNDVRAIKDEVMFPPNSARYKIYIIDEVHMLSTSAFNALLKTIEEPPPFVVFIFATTELQKVPATIKSRCQEFNFRLVSTEKIKSLLSEAAKELGITAEDEALYWIAKESGGSVRDSYTLFDQVAAFSNGAITYEKIRDKLGLIGVEAMNALFLHCANGEADKALLAIGDFIEKGSSIETIASTAAEYLRSLLLLKVGVTREGLLCAAATRFDTTILQLWTKAHIERALSLFLQLFRNIRSSVNARYELELAISVLSSLSDYITPSDVKRVIEKMRVALTTGANIQTALPPQKNTAAINTQSAAESGFQGNDAQSAQSTSFYEAGQKKTFSEAEQNKTALAASDNSAEDKGGTENIVATGAQSVADVINATRKKNSQTLDGSLSQNFQNQNQKDTQSLESQSNFVTAANAPEGNGNPLEGENEKGERLDLEKNGEGGSQANFDKTLQDFDGEKQNLDEQRRNFNDTQLDSNGTQQNFDDTLQNYNKAGEDFGKTKSSYSDFDDSEEGEDGDSYSAGYSEDGNEKSESFYDKEKEVAKNNFDNEGRREQNDAPTPQFVEDIKARVSGTVVKCE